MLAVKSPIYFANFVVDMRKSIDGLTLLVVNHFNESSYPKIKKTEKNHRDSVFLLFL